MSRRMAPRIEKFEVGKVSTARRWQISCATVVANDNKRLINVWRKHTRELQEDAARLIEFRV